MTNSCSRLKFCAEFESAVSFLIFSRKTHIRKKVLIFGNSHIRSLPWKILGSEKDPRVRNFSLGFQSVCSVRLQDRDCWTAAEIVRDYGFNGGKDA